MQSSKFVLEVSDVRGILCFDTCTVGVRQALTCSSDIRQECHNQSLAAVNKTVNTPSEFENGVLLSQYPVQANCIECEFIRSQCWTIQDLFPWILPSRTCRSPIAIFSCMACCSLTCMSDLASSLPTPDVRSSTTQGNHLSTPKHYQPGYSMLRSTHRYEQHSVCEPLLLRFVSEHCIYLHIPV